MWPRWASTTALGGPSALPATDPGREACPQAAADEPQAIEHTWPAQNIAAFDDADALYLICTSTYGSGDVPDNARALYDSLDLQPKFLGHVRYGVIALGDRTYSQTFCFGGKKFDERLQGLGAQRIGDIWIHDASGGTLPETEGAEWCRQWLAQVLASTDSTETAT